MILAELSEKSAVHIARLSCIENGKENPTISTMKHIAYALGIPLNSLFEFWIHAEGAPGWAPFFVAMCGKNEPIRQGRGSNLPHPAPMMALCAAWAATNERRGSEEKAMQKKEAPRSLCKGQRPRAVLAREAGGQRARAMAAKRTPRAGHHGRGKSWKHADEKGCAHPHQKKRGSE